MKKVGKPAPTNSRLLYTKQVSIARRLKAKSTTLAWKRKQHFKTIVSRQQKWHRLAVIHIDFFIFLLRSLDKW
jgi:hypothetical protein